MSATGRMALLSFTAMLAALLFVLSNGGETPATRHAAGHPQTKAPPQEEQQNAPQSTGHSAAQTKTSSTMTTSGATSQQQPNIDDTTATTTTSTRSNASRCFDPVALFPMIPLEEEIRRIYAISTRVMHELNATFWPTDGTLLGMMRNGRVATDRDVDLQVHSTFDKCHSFLTSLRARFQRHCKLKSFKIASIKHKGRKVGRYVMVRMFRQFGTFDTGVDFNCVYTDDPENPVFFTHRGNLVPVPKQVFPLGRCVFYDTEVACPKDGYAVLDALKPRYVGCMVFPHCFGDPLISVRQCLSPHPMMPLAKFVETTTAIGRCGYTSMAAHAKQEPQCAKMLEAGEKVFRCETIQDAKLCFAQKFSG